jgi:hypothetical protein
MLTVNQRDILAAAIADRYVLPGDPIEKWVEEYEKARALINEYEERRCSDEDKK